MIIDIVGWYIFIGLIVNMLATLIYVFTSKLKLEELTFDISGLAVSILLWPIVLFAWLRDLLFNRV